MRLDRSRWEGAGPEADVTVKAAVVQVREFMGDFGNAEKCSEVGSVSVCLPPPEKASCLRTGTSAF